MLYSDGCKRSSEGLSHLSGPCIVLLEHMGPCMQAKLCEAQNNTKRASNHVRACVERLRQLEAPAGPMSLNNTQGTLECPGCTVVAQDSDQVSEHMSWPASETLRLESQARQQPQVSQSVPTPLHVSANRARGHLDLAVEDIGSTEPDQNNGAISLPTHLKQDAKLASTAGEQGNTSKLTSHSESEVHEEGEDVLEQQPASGSAAKDHNKIVPPGVATLCGWVCNTAL
jgi:hypothetical protein